MTTHQKHHAPWYLWPFVAIWKLLAVIVEMTGRLVAMIIGIVLMLVGGLVSLTVIGAIVGVPLAIVGLLLFIKGIFKNAQGVRSLRVAPLWVQTLEG